MYDAAGTVDLAAVASGSTTSLRSSSFSPLAPASAPLQQTRSTDSATTTSSASATSSASDAENENSWASSWIDHELEFGDDSLASNLKMGATSTSHNEKSGGDAATSSPFRLGGIFGTVGGSVQSFPGPVDGQPDLDEPEELLTDLTPMPLGPSATSTGHARTDSPPPALPTIAPLFSSATPTRQQQRPANPDVVVGSKVPRALEPDGRDDKPRPLSEFDWAAAYGEAPATDCDVASRLSMEAPTVGGTVQTDLETAGGNQVSELGSGRTSSAAGDSLASAREAPALDHLEANGTPEGPSAAGATATDHSILPDSGPASNPPLRPLSWVERPASRASVRSTAPGTPLVPGSPAPPRPPRRQPSNVSLASVRNAGPAATASPAVPVTAPLTSMVEAIPGMAVMADSPRPESVATSSSYATADASPSIPSSSQPNRHSRTFSGDAVASSYRAPLTPSPARKERGPAPVVPVKSARRASLLVRQRSFEPGGAARKLSTAEVPSPVSKGEIERTEVREDSPSAEAVSSSLLPIEIGSGPLRYAASLGRAAIECMAHLL